MCAAVKLGYVCQTVYPRTILSRIKENSFSRIGKGELGEINLV